MNIYMLARENAGLSQKDAAPLVFTNVRSLSDFEMNHAIPKDDIVCRMIEVYNAPWLAYQHLSTSNKVGLMYLPKMEDRSLAQSVLMLQKEMNDVARQQSERVSIAEDKRIETALWPSWYGIAKKLAEHVRASLAAMFPKK